MQWGTIILFCLLIRLKTRLNGWDFFPGLETNLSSLPHLTNLHWWAETPSVIRSLPGALPRLTSALLLSRMMGVSSRMGGTLFRIQHSNTDRYILVQRSQLLIHASISLGFSLLRSINHINHIIWPMRRVVKSCVRCFDCECRWRGLTETLGRSSGILCLGPGSLSGRPGRVNRSQPGDAGTGAA